ncbi:MAG: hypothetical protein LQ343_000615 [Gyalolechia ehrenbergii]|nr:MAG: hypothetical protein LQ343_000615 [Gyalolechia ehrenbergii]
MPLQMTDIERAFLDQRTQFLRSEMRQEDAIARGLGIVGRYDAQRMDKELYNMAAQIAYEEIEMARNGASTTFISDHVATQKQKTMHYITPKRCYACRGNGHENDKMVRTCGTIDLPNEGQHWHHGSCLRANFLIASKDEEKMPPTCVCGTAIPDAYGYEVLSDAEFREYRNKREEMRTVNRTYCPVPTCSYFISPHLIGRAIDDRVAELRQMAKRPKGYVDPKHAPLNPPGAAPTLTTLEEHYKATLAGEGNDPGTALDGDNPTSNSIALSLDINDKLEPNRPVTNGSAATAGKRKKSAPLAPKITMNPR